MRLLLPPGAFDVDPLRVLVADDRPPPADRPWVLANMVSSIDGATDVAGVSGSLGGPADREMFLALRSIADVVLVGAGTVRTEHYGTITLPEPLAAARHARGQAPLPRLAILTSRLDLDLTNPLFAEPAARPIIVTHEAAPAGRRRAADAVADVVVAGATTVDVAGALAQLRARFGATTVLCEGGPTVIGTLAAADLLDEMCWTVANALAGGDSPRLAHGPAVAPLLRLRLDRILEADSTLFLRYTRLAAALVAAPD